MFCVILVASQKTPPLAYHQPISHDQPGRNQKQKTMTPPKIVMAARRWCKHQCTESPAPENEEMPNISHQEGGQGREWAEKAQV